MPDSKKPFMFPNDKFNIQEEPNSRQKQFSKLKDRRYTLSNYTTGGPLMSQGIVKARAASRAASRGRAPII